MIVIHEAAEPMVLTSPPEPNPWAARFGVPDRQEPRHRYTVQLCRRCGTGLAFTDEGLRPYPAGAHVAMGSGRRFQAMCLASTQPTCQPARDGQQNTATRPAVT